MNSASCTVCYRSSIYSEYMDYSTIEKNKIVCTQCIVNLNLHLAKNLICRKCKNIGSVNDNQNKICQCVSCRNIVHVNCAKSKIYNHESKFYCSNCVPDIMCPVPNCKNISKYICAEEKCAKSGCVTHPHVCKSCEKLNIRKRERSYANLVSVKTKFFCYTCLQNHQNSCSHYLADHSTCYRCNEITSAEKVKQIYVHFVDRCHSKKITICDNCYGKNLFPLGTMHNKSHKKCLSCKTRFCSDSTIQFKCNFCQSATNHKKIIFRNKSYCCDCIYIVGEKSMDTLVYLMKLGKGIHIRDLLEIIRSYYV